MLLEYVLLYKIKFMKVSGLSYVFVFSLQIA